MSQLSNGSIDLGVAAVPRNAVPREGSESSKTPESIARALYADLREKGFTEQQVIALAGELLSLVTADVRTHRVG